MTLDESLARAERYYLEQGRMTVSDPPKEPVDMCSLCEDELYDGDTAYELGENIYCEDCVRSSIVRIINEEE